MSENKLNRHISEQFNIELEDMRNRIFAMGGLVEQQIRDAMQSLQDSDLDLAKKVVETDHIVNAMEVAIDEECLKVIALRQPAAIDLRLVLAVVKVITDLERMGDEAAGIAKLVLKLDAEKQSPHLLQELGHMGKLVRQMVHNALDAMARMDAEAALRVARQDVDVDHECKGLTRQLITYMLEDPRNITSSLHALWAARALERIGDHACNICEYVIYFVKGKDVRHTDLNKMDEMLSKEK